jgi:hypothetical protein
MPRFNQVGSIWSINVYPRRLTVTLHLTECFRNPSVFYFGIYRYRNLPLRFIFYRSVTGLPLFRFRREPKTDGKVCVIAGQLFSMQPYLSFSCLFPNMWCLPFYQESYFLAETATIREGKAINEVDQTRPGMGRYEKPINTAWKSIDTNAFARFKCNL